MCFVQSTALAGLSVARLETVIKKLKAAELDGPPKKKDAKASEYPNKWNQEQLHRMNTERGQGMFEILFSSRTEKSSDNQHVAEYLSTVIRVGKLTARPTIPGQDRKLGNAPTSMEAIFAWILEELRERANLESTLRILILDTYKS